MTNQTAESAVWWDLLNNATPESGVASFNLQLRNPQFQVCEAKNQVAESPTWSFNKDATADSATAESAVAESAVAS